MQLSDLDEFCQFLQIETRLDVKSLAIHHILSLTGDKQGCRLIIDHAHIIDLLLKLAFNPREQKSVVKDALLTFINLTSDDMLALIMLKKHPDLIRCLFEYLFNPNSKFTDPVCALLANLSRDKECSRLIYKTMLENENKFSMAKLIQLFCIEDNKRPNKLDHLASLICNLTQIDSVRRLILEENSLLFKKLLPFTTYERSITRRGGILGMIKNCCFYFDYHENLLKSDIDLLSRLLLPLAGPEEFDDDDMDKLPVDLQYLPNDKQREHDRDLRIMLIETLTLLCSKKVCREYVKSKNAYVILRELYNWEKDELAKETCLKLINILISDEPQIGMENLHEVKIPDELARKLEEAQKQDMNTIFNEKE